MAKAYSGILINMLEVTEPSGIIRLISIDKILSVCQAPPQTVGNRKIKCCLIQTTAGSFIVSDSYKGIKSNLGLTIHPIEIVRRGGK